MKNKIIIYTSIGLFTLVLAGVGAAKSLPRDYNSAIQNHLDMSTEEISRARDLSCQQLGDLSSKCARHKGNACTELQAASEDYMTHFGGQYQYDCFNDEATSEESPTATSSAGDPLFYGDEEQ